MSNDKSSSLHPLSTEQPCRQVVEGIVELAIFMLDSKGQIKTWNAGAHRMFGYESKQITGDNFARLHTAQEQVAGLPAETLSKASADGKFTREGWRVRKDGSRFRARIAIEAVRNSAGELAGFAEVTRNLDEVDARDGAPAREEQFRRLVEGVANQAIYLLSPLGSVLTWNRGAECITGYFAADVIGTNFSRFHTEQDRELEIPREGLRMAAREGYFEWEGWRIRRDGSDFLAHVVIYPLHDESGILTGFAEVTRDVTENNRVALEREEARATRQQRRRIDAMGQLADGIAHDFNNVLASTASSVEKMGRDPTNAQLIARARQSLDRGRQLTQQLLTLAQRQPGHTEKLDLNQVIEDQEAGWRDALRDRITLHTRFGRNLPAVCLDPKLFALVMRALVVGVHQAMSSGGRIDLFTEDASLRERRKAGERMPQNGIRVVLRYTGAGLAADLVERALRPAFEDDIAGFVEGTDLGMTRLYAFVAEADGDITIESRPNEDAGFSSVVEVIMHFRPALGGMDLGDSNVDDASPVSDSPGTALIVEDEPDVLAVSTELFRSLGYNVLTAENGLEAVDILRRSQPIDVLFTDVVMPRGMSGVSLARLTAEIRPTTRVILASGYPMSVIVKDHGDIANFNFISKPYRWSELVERLKAPAAPARD
jgi:PAS domain S-box-containing protein